MWGPPAIDEVPRGARTYSLEALEQTSDEFRMPLLGAEPKLALVSRLLQCSPPLPLIGPLVVSLLSVRSIEKPSFRVRPDCGRPTGMASALMAAPFT